MNDPMSAQGEEGQVNVNPNPPAPRPPAPVGAFVFPVKEPIYNNQSGNIIAMAHVAHISLRQQKVTFFGPWGSELYREEHESTSKALNAYNQHMQKLYQWIAWNANR